MTLERLFLIKLDHSLEIAKLNSSLNTPICDVVQTLLLKQVWHKWFQVCWRVTVKNFEAIDIEEDDILEENDELDIENDEVDEDEEIDFALL